MVYRSVDFDFTTGPGLPPEGAPARMFVRCRPAFPFVDADAINWDVWREFDVAKDGTLTITGMQDTYLGNPMTWQFEVLRWDRRSNEKLVERVYKQFPGGVGAVDYEDMTTVDEAALPEFGPSWAEQAHASAVAAAASAASVAGLAGDVEDALESAEAAQVAAEAAVVVAQEAAATAAEAGQEAGTTAATETYARMNIAELDRLSVALIDFTTGRYQLENVNQRPARVFTDKLTTQSAQLAPFPAHAAVINLFPAPLVGGTLGVDQYASSSPGSGATPTGIDSHANASRKTWTVLNPTTIGYQSEWSSGWGGFRTQALTFSTDLEISGYVTVLNGTYTGVVDALVGMRVDGTELSDSVSVATTLEGRTKFTARLHMPVSGTSKTITFQAYPNALETAASNNPTSGQTVFVVWEEIVIMAAPTATKNDYWQAPQYLTGTNAALNQTFKVPDGSWVVVADTVDGGALALRATASGGTGLSLTSLLLGNFTIRRLWIVDPDDYYPELLDLISPIKLVNIPYRGSPSLVARALRRAPYKKLGTLHATAVSVPYARVKQESLKAVQVALDRRAYTLFDLSVGDTATADGVAATERTEIVGNEPCPAGTELHASYTMVLHDVFPDKAGTTTVDQERYTNVSGDNSSLSPDFAVLLYRDSSVRPGGRISFAARYNASSPVTNELAWVDWDFDVPNRPIEIVRRLVFGRDTAGEAQIWVNGIEIYNGTPIMGYDKDEGVQNHFGIYRPTDPQNARMRISFHNFERDIAGDLSSRVTAPLPLQRSLVID